MSVAGALHPAAALGRWLDDHMNPIVVKELRQAVNSWFILAVMMLFLLVQLLVIGIFLMTNDDLSQNFQAGRTMFMILQGVLLGTCLLCVPAYAGVRLGAERSDTNVDLLFITTISAPLIVWGKFAAAMIITTLIYSACAPFMVITYLLRGLDLPSVFIVLAMDLVLVAAAVQAALFLAAIPVSRLIQGILALMFLIQTMAWFSWTMAAAAGFLFFGIGSSLGSWDFWGPALGFVIAIAAACGLLFVLTVAMLTPPSANRAPLVRLYLLGAWLITTCVAIGLASLLQSGDFILPWLSGWMMLLNVSIVVSSGEREDWGPRIRRTIPRNPLLRAGAMLLYSGAAGGLLFNVGLVGLTLLVVWLWVWAFGQHTGFISMDDLKETIKVTGPMTLLVLAYTLTAVLIRRHVLRGAVKTPVVPALTAALLALATVLPMIVAFFLAPQTWYRHDDYWLLPNPLGSMINSDDATFRFNQLILGAIWSAVAALLCLPWFIQQVKRFQPLTPRPVATEQPATTAAPA